MPLRIAALPCDRRGYPVPRFVHWLDGVPDFRVLDPTFMAAAVRQRLCWICGQPLGRKMVFSIGPMCIVNGISAEPPSHRECAEYAARVCPFLAIPLTHRTESKRPHVKGPGIMLTHNPGVTALWVTRSYKPFRPSIGNGRAPLFQMGEPIDMTWYREGAPATHDQVIAAMRLGIPALIAAAKADRDPRGAMMDLRIAVRAAAKWTPDGVLPTDLIP
jgi:ferredoxin